MVSRKRLDDIRAHLRAAGDEYYAAKGAMDNARDALNPLIVEALKAGVPPSEVQSLSHLSHATIRTIRRAAGLPPAQRGGARR
jgi:hypothetical protein